MSEKYTDKHDPEYSVEILRILFEINQKDIVLFSAQLGSVIIFTVYVALRQGGWEAGGWRLSAQLSPRMKIMQVNAHSLPLMLFDLDFIYKLCASRKTSSAPQRHEGNLLRVYPFIHSQAYACMQDRSLGVDLSCTIDNDIYTSPISTH